MPSLGIDLCGKRQAATGHRIGVLLLDDDAVFNDLGICRRHLAAYRRGWLGGRRSGRNGRLLGSASGQKQASDETGIPHLLCFRSVAARLSMANLITRAREIANPKRKDLIPYATLVCRSNPRRPRMTMQEPGNPAKRQGNEARHWSAGLRSRDGSRARTQGRSFGLRLPLDLRNSARPFSPAGGRGLCDFIN